MTGCNIEMVFKNVELPVFSDQQYEYLRIDQFENFHQQEAEIAKMIFDNDKKKDEKVEKKYETEHRYIDFSDTIIGEKIKRISKIKKKSDCPRFDDIYYSKYMLKCETNNLDFYL